MAFESLQRARFALLTTYRRDGAAVPTPVWVGVAGGLAYVVSRGPGKVRRIRNNPTVSIAPCTSRGRPSGKAEEGMARIVSGPVPAGVRRAFSRKYGPVPAFARGFSWLLRKELVLLEITAAAPSSGPDGERAASTTP